MLASILGRVRRRSRAKHSKSRPIQSTCRTDGTMDAYEYITTNREWRSLRHMIIENKKFIVTTREVSCRTQGWCQLPGNPPKQVARTLLKRMTHLQAAALNIFLGERDIGLGDRATARRV